MVVVFVDRFPYSSRVTTSRPSATVRECSRQPQIANLDLTVLVDEDVRRLDVAVDDVHRVHLLEGAEEVVHD